MINLGPLITSPVLYGGHQHCLYCRAQNYCFVTSTLHSQSLQDRDLPDRGTGRPAGLEHAPQLIPPLETPGRLGGMVFKLVEYHSATTNVARTLALLNDLTLSSSLEDARSCCSRKDI